MLWKKESNSPNTLYEDLFDRKTIAMVDKMFPMSNRNPVPRKNDVISLQKRKEGNRSFANGKWAEAIEKYNESLCFATTASEHISLAYANRASCFLHLKLYNECLIDIDLARKAGYPERLMPKLDQREGDCLKGRDDSIPLNEFNQKLSFEPDEKIPCMANVLKIEKNDAGKLSMVAKDNIDVGQTIILGKPFCVYLYSRFAWKCNICLKDNTNLVSCKKCTNVMFCSDECQSNDLHNHECGLKFIDDGQQNAQYLNEIRVLLLAINIFHSNIDELMSFVEQTVKSEPPREVPMSLADDQSKYRAFLKFPISAQFARRPDFLLLVYSIYKACQTIPYIAAKFSSLKHRRFLMHLIAHHIQITNFNSYQVNNQKTHGVDFYHQIGLMTKYFRHSCAPNVLMTERDGISIYTAIRSIKKGDELFISYFKFLGLPKHVRQQELWNQVHIKCNCSRCMGAAASSDQRQQLATDPDFPLILSSASNLSPYASQKIEDTIEKCIAFLTKYGQIKWCDEIGEAVDAYIKTLDCRIPRPLFT
ncbi:SET and MYND domain-containing protein DDB_G0273589-like [Sitodiplosis mosellana]|uniref:SET and MYND domain-containing protein DDB_G0273589-like n=1 Tax=Sitodiplosis mosellana TaxID=263140 RepID=UPI00244527CB|nr:SET and MYND domain-containing protein DDB_G0273589-like [Sitodiplosis mosellana]XP_055298562.1 SET and MYND domain-containing protein DDB_G0273589-like [Sitodiplosis mosellana]